MAAPTVVLLIVLNVKHGVRVDKHSAVFKHLVGGLGVEVSGEGKTVHQRYGFAVEDPGKLYWLLDFDQDVKAADVKLPTTSDNLSQDIRVLITGPPEIHLLQFTAFPSGATSGAPVSEVVSLTLKPDVDIDGFLAYQDTITDALMKEPAFRDIARSVPDRERRALSVFVGWDSVEAHMRWAKANSALLERFGQSMESGGMVHVSFVELA